MELAVNLQNDLQNRFALVKGKRTLINGDVYIRFNGGVGSRVISSVFMWFCILL